MEIEKKDIDYSVEQDIIEKRKEKVKTLFKGNLIYYIILAVITFLGFYIRTRNIDKLKDITTNSWTLGPDLDPFLFLRWAKYIVKHGSLMTIDMMRNVPLGFNTAGEMKLLAYMITWFYYFLNIFKDITVTYAAILFPTIMFAFTTIAFFLFTRKIFYKENKRTKNIIALIASAFFIVMPSLLSRTIAGIPEKESAGFFFMFIAFYFFLSALESKTIKKSYLFALLTGIATACMGLIWGGVMFIFITLSISMLMAFILGKVKKREFTIYTIWLISSFLIMRPFSTRYTIVNLLSSTTTGLAFAVLGIFIIDLLLFKIEPIKEKITIKLKRKTKLPNRILSLVVSGVILIILASLIFGPGFLFSQINEVSNALIEPSETRFSFTVAENAQPYFEGWANNFGPVIKGIPLYFWIFFIGTIFLFNLLIKKMRKKERVILTSAYTIFLISIIFSRYSGSKRLMGILFNGTNTMSVLFYFFGVFVFVFSFAYFYWKRYKQKELSVLKEFNIGYILYFIVLTLGIIGARGAVRLIMFLAAVSPVAVACFSVKLYDISKKEKDDLMRIIKWVILIVVVISLLYTFNFYYKGIKASAENFAPGTYQWQWQKAMQWVRENTPPTLIENEEFKGGTVFAHWWDYGYWLQSIGNRATVLDGGNAIVYWNHLLGRHVLTGKSETEALGFLYTHNATHLLIDSTDIGKYPAFSSIGADENYDRYSWISTFLLDQSQTQETNNQTTVVYQGGTPLDEDIIYEFEGETGKVFLPAKKAICGAVLLKKSPEGKILQAEGIYFYNNQQYRIPLKYVYANNKLYEFSDGIKAGIFIYPSLDQTQGFRINEQGAALYLSPRTIDSNLARLYLFNQGTYFKLAHTQSSEFVSNLREQGIEVGEFLHYNGFQGPIKIWNINYPSNIQIIPQYLEKKYPSEELEQAKPGIY